MPVSPMDFELYSRVTGSPMPMSAAERMKMAPEVYQFTKDYTKSQNRQAMGRNILKIGALGALGAAAYYGSRNFGTPSQELGQELTETSTAANLVENAAEKAAQSVGSNTVSQSLATDQTPALTEENAVVTAEEPSQLNINAALERKDAPLPSAEKIRRQYSKTVTSPAERQERNVAALLGGGEYYLGQTVSDGEVIKTEDSSGFDDKGKSILGKYVGMMKDGVDEDLKELTGPTAPDFEQTLVSDSPLVDNPRSATDGGQSNNALSTEFFKTIEDINVNGTNTSATANLQNILTPEIIGVATALSKGELAQGISAEEQLVIAQKIVEAKNNNPLEQRAVDNEAAMGSMRLSDEERKKESIRLGSTGGIPNKTDMVEIRKDPEYIAAQESMKPKSAIEKVDEFTSKIMPKEKSSFVDSMSMDLSADKTPTATFNLSQKDGSTKPYSVEISSPMAVSLNEMAEDGSLPEESFGKLFNLAKKSIKDKSGMAFGIDQ